MSKFIVFGITAPIGCDKKIIYDFFKEKKEEFNYEYNKPIVLSDILKDLTPDDTQGDRFTKLINTGNELRKIFKCNEVLAIYAITKIISELLTKKDVKKTQVFVVSSLKHNDEVEALKKTFGINFFLIGLSSSKEIRSHCMIADGLNEKEIADLNSRNENENIPHGQQMEKIYKKSDIFVDIDNEKNCKEEMQRFLELLYGHPFHTPKKNEFFMYLAYATSTRSASYSRQIGAAIVSERNELISIGCNEVSKCGGGQYWPDDNPDHREFKSSQVKSTNKMEIDKIVKDILSKITVTKDKDESNQNHTRIQECIERSSIYEVIEFFREEHAEAEAISSCARNGRSTLKAKLYCTTLPCHLCLKAIISAGIKEVFFIEPYPKSKTYLFELFSK